MKTEAMNDLLHLMAGTNPKSIFLEIAFTESWVGAVNKRHKGVPLAMVERSLSFWEQEFNYRPRLVEAPPALLRPAWAARAISWLAIVWVVAGQGSY